MSERVRKMAQNGNTQQTPSIPKSVRTVFMAGGQIFVVDEDVRTFDAARREFMAKGDEHAVLWMHVDHRETCFSYELMKLFVYANTARKDGDIETVEEPEFVRQINQRRS